MRGLSAADSPDLPGRKLGMRSVIMTAIDIEKLLEDVSLDAPCGEDLEYDWAFLELERKMQGTPEHSTGDVISDAAPPNWGEIRDNAIDLFSRSKDLRLAVFLTHALLNTDGLDGLRSGLELIEGLVEKYWDCLHPQLDPDDDNDPTSRINSLVILSDHQTVLKDLRESNIVASRTFGRWSLRDVDIAQGKYTSSSNDDVSPTQMADIDAAFMDTDLVQLESMVAVTKSCQDHVQAIERQFITQTGDDYIDSLSGLNHVLLELQQLIEEQLARRGTVEIPGGSPATPREPIINSTELSNSEIDNREDLLRFLGGACNYMTRNEPSHPAGPLLQKAMRLLSNDFIGNVQDIAPDAIVHIESIRGLTTKSAVKTTR